MGVRLTLHHGPALFLFFHIAMCVLRFGIPCHSLGNVPLGLIYLMGFQLQWDWEVFDFGVEGMFCGCADGP